MREQIRLFILRSGMTQGEFGAAIGYSHQAVSLFITGQYGKHHYTASNSVAIRAAAKEFMDTHALHDGYEVGTCHHSTAAFEEIRRCTLNALRRGTAYLVDGPPGTEKTHSFRQIEKEIRDKGLGRAVYVYARVNHSPHSFLQEICCSAGIPNRGSIDQLLRKVRFFLGNGRTLLMVDEGQHLNHAGLEVLRQLVDLPPYFGVVIGGSHDLTQRLSHWQMEQWRSRLRKTIYLNGPSAEEGRAILRAELGMDLTDADCDTTIAQCEATGVRVEYKGGRAIDKPFKYTSMRDLFFAIERTQEKLAEINAAQRKGKVA